EDLVPGPDDRVLRLPGKVGAIEVGQVVVEDARLGRLAGDRVPDRLIEAPGDQVPAGQVHPGRPGQHLGQRAVTPPCRPELRQLLLDWKLPGAHARFVPPSADAARPPTETTGPARGNSCEPPGRGRRRRAGRRVRRPAGWRSG